MKADSAIGSDKLAKIVAACEGLSAQWLLTGRGPMFMAAGLMTPQEAAVQEREAGAGRWNVYDAPPAGTQAAVRPQNPAQQEGEAWLVCDISYEDIPDEECPRKAERKSGRPGGEGCGRGQDGEGRGPGEGCYGREGNARDGGRNGSDGPDESDYSPGGNVRTGGQDEEGGGCGQDGSDCGTGRDVARLIRDLRRRMAEKDAVIISLQQRLIEAQAQLLAYGKGRKK